MTPQEKQEIKHLIETQLQQVVEEIARLEEATKPISPENAIGRISRMDAINNKTISEAALRENKDKQTKLSAALFRIDTAEFGKCFRCGSDIPIGRLKLLPYSMTCVRCASR
jgi:DnaK suppressor protein